MRCRLRRLSNLVGFVVALIVVADAHAQPVKPRISVMVDSSGSMLLTPEIVTTPETCVAQSWNGCVNTGLNPTLAQESCNACVAWTTRVRPACATAWTSGNGCAGTYTNCYRFFYGSTATCGQTLNLSEGVPTRGDGTALTPGCDVDGDGQANDSRMYQAKEAVNNVVATFGEVEFALWRYAQVEGGQSCATDASCPDTPGGSSVLTCENVAGANVCALDAANIGSATGQCNMFTWNGADSTFACSQCSDAGGSAERLLCEAYQLDRIRTGGTSPLAGTVNCALPSTSHPFMMNHGGCDPSGGERLVDFPATGFDDNYAQIRQWIDHQQPNVSTDVEINAQGGTPIAASLRDMRTAIYNSARLDTRTPCRKHQVIFLTDGGESCETVADAVTAAGTFQNMSFTNAAGTVVPDYDVPVYVIGFAVCPPGQPNCQTRQDLNSIAAAGGTGTAILVNSQLELQLALAQIVASSVLAERCNNLDDDCDGAIDEDFPGRGATCSAGVGACFASGTVQCTADQTGLACNATAGTPSPEVCNGLDDNCDGLIDNGISCTGCVPVCADAAHCDICNNIDEDCDAVIDEDFAPTSCGVDAGACAPGTTACVAGTLSCTGGVGPVAEACNNVDDDCDAIVDGMTQACYPPATAGCNPITGVCLGVCRLGTQTCTTGSFGACTGARTPGVEIPCNGLDDDCDGLVDEGGGTEQCNGLDDNCNGMVDEGVATTDPDIGDPCGTPPFIGTCRQGAIACVAGAEVCQGEINPTGEVCDNADNDCDGVVDDGVPGFGGACGSTVGRCDPGTLQCVAGAPVCVGAVGPFAEVCNSADDNCNGATDETDPMLGDTCNTLPGGATVPSETGECQFGVLACQAGGLSCVGAIGPVVERCNALDDDCDGLVDETFPTLGTACDNGALGVCRQTGVVVCSPSGGTTCTAPPGVPGTETCNGLDDDCDGVIDDGPLPLVGTECAPGTGVCAPGLWACTAGVLTCGQPSSGSPEICNGSDDDCDAQVDESPPGSPLPGEEEPCVAPGFEPFMDVGECEFGQTACVAGGLDCLGYQGPSPEICDGLDNDCDGNADDLATCPAPTDACHAGTCVQPCGAGEFPCGGGFICEHLDDVPVPGNYCVPDPCNGVTCAADEVCDPATRMCRNLCDGVTCQTGEQCQLGVCVDCFDVPTLCMAGELCVRDGQGVGQCQDNPCDPNPCQVDETCVEGVCMGGCGAGCPDGEVCVGGACVSDPCDGVTCRTGEVCDPATGDCVNQMCSGVQCRPGEVCVETTGSCIADPCLSTNCPMGQECSVDPGGRPVCADPDAPTIDRVTAAGGGCAAGGGGGGLGAAVGLALLALTRRRRARRAAGGAA
jgi:hypothetical protein